MHIHNDKSKTKRQWNDQGYKIIDEEKYTEFWSNSFCNAKYQYYYDDNVEKMTDEEFEEYKQQQKEAKAKRRKQLKQQKEELNNRIDRIREKYYTAFQLLELGYIANGKCIIGNDLNKMYFKYDDLSVFGSNYYYYDINNCMYDKAEAERLKKTYSSSIDYNGKKWW